LKHFPLKKLFLNQFSAKISRTFFRSLTKIVENALKIHCNNSLTGLISNVPVGIKFFRINSKQPLQFKLKELIFVNSDFKTNLILN